MNAVIEKSDASSPMSMKTCLVSEPQIPVRRVRSTTQSGPSSVGSGTSWSAIGVVARPCSSRCSTASRRRGGEGWGEPGVDTEDERSHRRGSYRSGAPGHLPHDLDEHVGIRRLPDDHVVLTAEATRELGRGVVLEAVALDRVDDRSRRQSSAGTNGPS